jgi:asparagine synthetase B (glutamine-hydrolysing)
VSDFAITFDAHADTSAAAEMLSQRPHLSSRSMITRRFPWGAVVVQVPPTAGYVPFTASSGAFYFCVGRPILRGTAASPTHDGFLSAIASRWSETAVDALWQRLSGVFVFGRCDDHGLTLLTDPMGVRPAYVASDEGGRLLAAGSHVDSVAQLSGRRTSFDLTSLAELLIFSNVTYPFTTRQGISELPPASISRFDRTSSGVRVATGILWEPREIEPSTSDDFGDELVHAMRVAAREMTDGVESVGFTLSGGRDSRAILAALPEDKRGGAITFMTRHNRESTVAQKVAAAAGVPHFFAERPVDFYERLMERTVALQGSEQRGQAHGLCVPDTRLDERFDLIVSGQLADTFLKDHFMPEWLRARTMSSTLGRLRRWLGGGRSRPPANGIGTVAWLEHQASLVHLRPEFIERVRERHKKRLEEVARVRPISGAEWVGIWPASRRYSAASHVQGNSRTFASDVLYAHRGIIDVAVRIPLRLRVDGALANQAFRRLYGPLAAIEDANTGVPVDAGERAERQAHRQRERSGGASQFKRLPPSDSPWNDVQSSWADMKMMQQRSAHWAALRARLVTSPALDVIAPVLAVDPREIVRAYQTTMSFATNFMAIQLANYIDAAGRRNS